MDLTYITSLLENNYLLAIILFWLLYVLSTTFSIPGASALTISSGALFGFVDGLIVSYTAAFIGALIIYFFFDYFKLSNKMNHPKLEIAKKKIKDNELLGVISLRLTPIVPFFLVNVLCGILNVSRKNYIIGTATMLPWTIAYVGVGAGIWELIT